MYFWNINKLSEDLKKGLKETEQVKYFLAYIVLSYIVLFFPIENNIYDYFLITIDLFITIITLLICFKINGANKGKEFVARYLSLGFVLFIRVFLIFFGIAFILIMFLPSSDVIEPTGLIDAILEGAFIITYSYLLIRYFQKLNK